LQNKFKKLTIKQILILIQDINPDTRRRIRTGEKGRNELFELFLKDRERKYQQQQKLEQHLQKYNTAQQKQE
jgi:hypothetical protein